MARGIRIASINDGNQRGDDLLQHALAPFALNHQRGDILRPHHDAAREIAERCHFLEQSLEEMRMSVRIIDLIENLQGTSGRAHLVQTRLNHAHAVVV